jgi:enoyl-CoA hydratase / 3-hydroxyacyl-CoA dehydrogenase
MNMAYQTGGLRVAAVGVVGSGQIGPDIALHFAEALYPFGVAVTVVDVSPAALERGRARVDAKLGKARDKGALSAEAAAGIAARLQFTADYPALRDADLIVEAATEDVAIKRQIFATLNELCGPGAILASNSSHLPPEEIFAELPADRRSNTLVAHYFFPADRNPVVELVSSSDTAPELIDALLAFYEAIGKLPVRVVGRYGFAVNPVFEGLVEAAMLAVEAGLGSVKEVDAVTRKSLGMGVGPFTAMNLTGGNPITNHALDAMTTRLGRWFRTPQLLKDAVAEGKTWDVAGRDERVVVQPARADAIGAAMRGAYFGLAGEILDSRIITLADLEVAVESGLAMRAPFEFMNDVGVPEAAAVIERYAAAHPGFTVPRCVAAQAASGQPFRIDHVLRHDHGDIAVLTIRRPRVLNALNEEVYHQLEEQAKALRADSAIAGVVISGFGTRSFVSGADVNFLAGIRTPAEGVATSEASKRAGNLFEQLGKPVICALNGSAIGGGSELALCCTARIARKGLKVGFAQPEANLGIIPGAGGTQRLPRLVGVERAALMLRTGKPLSGGEAVQCGLVREEVAGDLIAAAVELARAAARGDVSLRGIDPAPIATPDTLPPVDIGPRSRAVDALVCRAVVEGCRLPLADGLRLESELFGEGCALEDMRIGVENFLKNGPRAVAAFAHR